MTQDEIIEMARQAGFIFLDGLGDDGECRKYGEAWPEQIEAFAKLVEARTAAKERCVGCEACIDTACGRDECPKGWPKAAQTEQEPVAHSVVAGALFDFMGWLTSRNKRLTLSGADEASPAVEAIQEFSEKRGLSLKDAEVGFWTEFLSTPPQRTWVGLSEEEEEDILRRATSMNMAIAKTEAKLKEKNTTKEKV